MCKIIDDKGKKERNRNICNPTMKKSSKAGAEETERNLELIQQFEDLEKEWETLKKGKLLNRRRCSTGSDSGLMTSFDQLLESSPRGIMYSLQHRRSPSDGFLRTKNCDMAVEEMLRERRAAILRGKLKGRRLFREAEEASEVELDFDYDNDDSGGGEIWCDSLNMIRERAVVINENCDSKKSREGEQELPDAFRQSCSFSDTYLSEDKEVVVEEKMVVEKRQRGGGGGRCIVAMAWLTFLLILLILGLISMSCNGKSLHENELTLAPT